MSFRRLRLYRPLGADMGIVLVGALVLLLTLVLLVLLNRVKVEPFSGWDSHSDL